MMAKPRFVKATLNKDGRVTLVDDEGEVFYVEMYRDSAWPIMSRLVRRFELQDAHEQRTGKMSPAPTARTPWTPKLVS